MTEPNTVFNWQGRGWYGNVQRNGAVWYEWCGEDRKQEPHTYTLGLGNPDWYDAPPTWAEEVKGADYTDDDDPPAMPTIEAALARIAQESEAAATAARAYLDGSEGKSVSIRVRVSVAEHAQIQQTAKALGYGSMSEFMRARVLE